MEALSVLVAVLAVVAAAAWWRGGGGVSSGKGGGGGVSSGNGGGGGGGDAVPLVNFGMERIAYSRVSSLEPSPFAKFAVLGTDMSQFAEPKLREQMFHVKHSVAKGQVAHSQEEE